MKMKLMVELTFSEEIGARNEVVLNVCDALKSAVLNGETGLAPSDEEACTQRIEVEDPENGFRSEFVIEG